MTVNKVVEKAREVVKDLLDKGMVLEVTYNEKTDVVYIRLDCGVCNSLRIATKPGEVYASYRYNLLPGITEEYKTSHRYLRYFYPFSKSDQLIEKILTDKEEKIRKQSLSRYELSMINNQKMNKMLMTFWQNAILIKTEEDINKALKIKAGITEDGISLLDLV